MTPHDTPPNPLRRTARILRDAIYGSGGPVWYAGIALIGIGIVLLYLSDKVANTPWWQGTLEAFGVGLIVGGIIDVLAINGLNQVLTGDQQRRANNLQAEAILRQTTSVVGTLNQAKHFLITSGHELDPNLYNQLLDLIHKIEPQWQP